MAAPSSHVEIGAVMAVINHNIHFNRETIIYSGRTGKLFSNDWLIFMMKNNLYIDLFI